ncbi:hypothetical protein DLAC_03315 [Tieghemostelium lacteum]|uniref:Uncharacterized protein n=1 Tax=Tieghemostelium lacteum TaxID=361077 RepID=A0A152A1N6_TIELA|nr:hypothetical protein DLAC_03315 [Tieghemostelium lacteum]|eukprot:KYR00162.1 hypothetical protein DLAC_03315 [Tieghemostelium lacteum]
MAKYRSYHFPNLNLNFQTLGLEKAKQLDIPLFLTFKHIENGRNMIKEASEKYFVENILYHVVDSRALKALGFSEAPVLDDTAKKMINYPGAKNFYKAFAKAFVPVAICQQDKIPFLNQDKIKPQLLEKYGEILKKVSEDHKLTYIKQTMLCQNRALLEKFPLARYYSELGPANNFPEKFKNYLLNHQEEWGENKTTDNFMVEYSALQVLMDFIDPELDLSYDIMDYYMGMGINKALANMSQVQDKYRENVIQAVLKCLFVASDKTINEFMIKMKDQLPMINGHVDVASNILGLVKSIMFPAVPTTDTVGQRVEKLITPALKNETRAKITAVKNGLNCLYRLIEGGILIATTNSTISKIDWSGNTTSQNFIQIASFMSDFFKFAIDTITSFSRVDKWLSNKVGGFLAKGIGAVAPSALEEMKKHFPKMFGFSSVGEFLLVFSGFMILYSSIGYMKSAKENQSKGNTGAYVMDLLLTGVSFVGASAALICMGLGLFPVAGVIVALVGLTLMALEYIKSVFFDNSQKENIELYIDLLIQKPGEIIEIEKEDPLEAVKPGSNSSQIFWEV